MSKMIGGENNELQAKTEHPQVMRVTYTFWNNETPGNTVGIPWYVPVTDSIQEIKDRWESEVNGTRMTWGKKMVLRRVEITMSEEI